MTPAEFVPLIDLTCLDEQATELTIEQLCKKAVTPFGAVAAICVYPRFVSLAQQCLMGTTVAIATVVNFPHGTDEINRVLADIETAIQSGATEIDVVIPYHFYLSQERSKVQAFLTACRQICSVKLKTILETGALNSTELIAIASTDAINAGVNFIKTSTGKISIGATLEAAAIMLATIKFSKTTKTGFKASGGIRQINQAMQYIQLTQNILESHWISPDTFRFGASGLLDEIQNDIGIIN